MLEIGMDPFLVGGLSWHGIFTAIGVAFAVFGTARLARRRGMDQQVVYSCAAWAVPGGVVGARLVHVIRRLALLPQQPRRHLLHLERRRRALGRPARRDRHRRNVGHPQQAVRRENRRHNRPHDARRPDHRPCWRRHQRRAFQHHDRPPLGLGPHPPELAGPEHRQARGAPVGGR